MIRSSRGTEEHYAFSTITVVLATEIFKLLFSLAFHLAFIPSDKWKQELVQICSQYKIAMYYAVPAVIYSFYNVLMYINLSLFTPTNYRVLINIRVLWSGLLFQLIFRTQLGYRKWSGLIILMLGCAVNQVSTDFSLDSSVLALLAISFQAFLSSAGGVYSELILKQNAEIPLVVKNIYLYFWSTLCNLLYITFFQSRLLVPENFFAGWDGLVYSLVVVGAVCGFSTSIFLRYLNVLLKEFAHSAEMLVTALLTAFLFGVPLTTNILFSIFLVGVSVYLYNTHGAAPKTVLPEGNQHK